MRAWGLLTGAVAIVALAATPAYGGSPVTCSFAAADAKMVIKWTDSAKVPGAFVDGSDIVVKGYGGTTIDVPCGPGGPTVTDVDKIVYRDKTGGSARAIVFGAEDFVPGASNAGGDAGSATNEIEFDVRMGSGPKDQFELAGSSVTSATYVLGSRGANVNATPSELSSDADVSFKGVERVQVSHEGDWTDFISGKGGAGTGDTFPLRLTIFGYGGNDFLFGGKGRDRIVGGVGADNMRSGRGRDRITAHDGIADVAINCGPDRDHATIDAFDPAPVSC